jgi:hypothetical protein
MMTRFLDWMDKPRINGWEATGAAFGAFIFTVIMVFA